MAINFRTLFQRITPPWLQGFYGTRLTGAMAFLFDVVAEGATQAVKAPWIATNTSPNDALPDAGLDANIPRAPAETDDQYRARLLDKWDLWAESATVLFAENSLAPFDVDAASITLIADREWDASETDTNWSVFWIILEPPLPWTEDTWGSAPVWGGDLGTWGSSATQEDIQAIIRFVCKWKSAHEIGSQVAIVWADQMWGFGDPWGTGVWGGGVTRWPLGRFWGDHKGLGGVWGDPDPYDSSATETWGGKLTA